ncbi:fimbrial usher protein [Escherichia coli]|nr:fimbrial usher protein [Escherichia coli]
MIMAAVPGQKLVHCNKKYKNTGHPGNATTAPRGHKRTPKQLALIIKRCLPMVLTGSGMLCTTANAEEVLFRPHYAGNHKSGMQTTDLSRFQKNMHNYRGTYQVDIWLNKKKVSQKKVTFTANAEQLLQPRFTVRTTT